MNDIFIKMGFKHTMFQRLQNYDVSPAKHSPSSSNSESADEQQAAATVAQPLAPLSPQVTDFSINRILGDGAHSNQKTNAKSTKSTFAIGPPLPAADILDLSKSSPTKHAQHRIPPTLPAYPTPTYQNFHNDFLAATAAANATKFYAQFFPHMFSPYLATSLSLSNLPTTPYQKRYFAPYIINSAVSSNPASANGSRLTSPANLLTSSGSYPKSACPRVSCSDCVDYYNQFPYKSPTPSVVPLSPASSSSCSSTLSANYLKSKSSAEFLLKSASSSLSLTTVTNLSLSSKSAKIGTTTTTSTLSSEEISYKCCICDKVFGCSQTLQAHEKTHKSPRYECTDCGKGFSQLRNYKYHLSVHRGTKEFAAECPECGKTFNDKGYLSSHMKIHRNKKEYECPYCPKSFNQRVAFNMHVRIHTGVKPHKCAECGKRFSRKMLLKQHMRTHSGEKPYQCSVCGKSFADRSNMTLHHRLHSGIKPFNCPICPKAFTKKHHLKTHLNYHTGCKPYVCPHPNCNQAFTQSSNMRTHAKKCQYRPLQLPFPVTSSSATTATAAAAATAAAQRIAATTLGAAPTAATHIPALPPHAYSAGIRLLSAASSGTSGGIIATPPSVAAAFPPAQQPLLGTLRPF